ncbi:MAG: GTPase ObgE [Clostridiales bacterium]|nr:GTPase ObgE [Clostridiales bacterium]
MFIDHAKIYVKAGDGGPGMVSFHTEKYITNGGPDGGDGGKGGDIVFVAVQKLTTLQAFRFKHKFVAPDGGKGMNRKMYGRGGEDLRIAVPVGTVVKDADTGRILADFTEDKQEEIICVGGKGGLGNMHFANSVRQAPQFAHLGLPGEEKNLQVELKLIADVGLVGFPNAGKSTLLSVMTRAKPKIADYPFTTLEPVLGVVQNFDTSFVIADIPGLIEDAHEGAGLGHDFLRHIERTRLLIHVVDISAHDGRDPIDDFKAINKELSEFNEELSKRPQVVVANKCDDATDEEIELFEEEVRALGYEDIFVISAAARQGIKELTDKVTELVSKLPPPVLHDKIENDTRKVYKYEPEEKFTIEKEDDMFVIKGSWISRLRQTTDFDVYDSASYFQRALVKEGVIEALKAAGIQEGDSVRIDDFVFEYVE